MNSTKTFRSKSNFEKSFAKIATYEVSNFDLKQLSSKFIQETSKPQIPRFNLKQLPQSQVSTLNVIDSLDSTHRSLKPRNHSLHHQNSQNLIQTSQKTYLLSPNQLKNSTSFQNSDNLSKNILFSQDFLDLNQQNQNLFIKQRVKRAKEVIPQVQKQVKDKNQINDNNFFKLIDIRDQKVNDDLGSSKKNDCYEDNQNCQQKNKKIQAENLKQLLKGQNSSQFNLQSQNNVIELINKESKQNQKSKQIDDYQKTKAFKKKMIQQRQNIFTQMQQIPIFQDLKPILNQFFKLYSMVIEEAEQRYILIPHQEKQLHLKMIEGEQYLHKILQSLTNHIFEIHQSVDSEKNDQKSKEFELNKQIGCLISQVNSQKEIDDAQKSVYNLIELSKKQNYELVLNNAHLLQLVKLNYQNFFILRIFYKSKNLASKLDEKQSNDNIKNIQIENEQLQKILSQLQEQNSQNIKKMDQNVTLLNSAISILKVQLKKSEEGKKNLEQSFKKISQLNQELILENASLKQQTNEIQQKFDLSNLENQSKMNEIDEMKTIIKINSKQIKELKEKLNKLTIQKMTFTIPPDNLDFNDEAQLFNSIQASNHNKGYFVKQVKATMGGFNTEQIQANMRKFEDEKDKNYQIIELTKFRYNLPQFYCFIQDDFQNLFKQVEDTIQIPLGFLGTVRGILDSMFYEFILCSNQNYKNVSLFADFTYSWLTNFDINQVSRKIMKLHTNTLTQNFFDVRVAQFYITLNNQHLSKLWEFLTFREILNEQLSKEELYFYLYCRNFIFKGPQLESISSTFEIINYIYYDEAEILIRSILTKFDKSTVEFLIQQIKKKTTQKGEKQFIDIHLVLRLLLEYLRTERQQRYRLIKQLFYSQKCEEKDGQFTLNFTSFRNIFHKNYLGTSELEKAQIFRECYSIGKGIVNHDTFFTVCDENGFFIKQLKLNLPVQHPQFNETIKQFEPQDLLLSKNYQTFQNLYNDESFHKNLQIISQYVQCQGLEFQLQNYEQFIKQNNKNSFFSDFQGNNYILFLFEKIKSFQISIYLKIFSKQHEIDDPQTIQIQKNLQEQLSSCCQMVIKILQNNKQKKYELQTQKIIILQRWAKRKISKWYALINDLLLQKFNMQLQQQGIQKSQKVFGQITEKTDNEEEEENNQDLEIESQASKKYENL